MNADLERLMARFRNPDPVHVAELVALVGPALAARYGAVIAEVRETERMMRERIGDG